VCFWDQIVPALDAPLSRAVDPAHLMNTFTVDDLAAANAVCDEVGTTLPVPVHL